MRIGFDAKRAFANKTGLGNYSRFVLQSLLRYTPENDVRAYTPKNNQNLFPDFPTEKIGYPNGFWAKKIKPLWRSKLIVDQLRQDKIELFHGLSHELPVGLNQAGIAAVVTIHDLIFERIPHLFKPIDRIIYRQKFRSACQQANAIIAISEQTKRDLIDLYQVPEERIEVIYQDCNPIFKQEVPQERRNSITKGYGIRSPYILSVGTIEERKNQLRLVEAFIALQQQDFQLVIIGKKTPYAEKIRHLISQNNLSDQILLLENVPTESLPALYQEAEVFAYVSVYEGFGIPILESLHSNTPVLSAKGSCLEEAGGPAGLYADPYDVNALSTQLSRLLSDPELRKSLVEAGKKHREKFSGELITAQLIDLYQSCLNKTGR
jgi:glycosyltransferase involved in cell wall biosynthesis